VDVHAVIHGSTPFRPRRSLYLAGYPLVGAGIFLLVHRLGAYEGRWPLVDAAIVTVALACCSGSSPSPEAARRRVRYERTLLVAYPVADVLLLAGLARFFVTPVWRTSAYRRLLASGVLLLVADELYVLSPHSYTSWADACWLLSYVLVAPPRSRRR